MVQYRQDEKRIITRIDRMYADCDRISKYGNANVRHLKKLASYHRPLLLDTRGFSGKVKRDRRFIFELYWLENDGLLQHIKDNWGKIIQIGNMASLFEGNLVSLGKSLCSWSKEKNGSLENNLRRIMEELAVLEGMDESGLTADSEWLKIKLLTNKALALNRQLHIKWWTKARTVWVEMNDKNTRFFHNLAKYKKRKNTILDISMEGKLISDIQQIIHCFVSWYKDLWKEEAGYHTNWDEIRKLKWKKIPMYKHNELTGQFTEHEILSAMKSLGRGKAPEPDGFSIGFFLNF
ncbi:hypothetical protein Cni_G25173 [Canna indica]|uniref:Uncharacterized protein n=1 Tax=Canna indica TaxID=4628 RepID=A0AAQ3QKT5_9LILI|nr:hypothetical protein Cni_G25173 [Canna indica]